MEFNNLITYSFKRIKPIKGCKNCPCYSIDHYKDDAYCNIALINLEGITKNDFSIYCPLTMVEEKND